MDWFQTQPVRSKLKCPSLRAVTPDHTGVRSGIGSLLSLSSLRLSRPLPSVLGVLVIHCDAVSATDPIARTEVERDSGPSFLHNLFPDAGLAGLEPTLSVPETDVTTELDYRPLRGNRVFPLSCMSGGEVLTVRDRLSKGVPLRISENDSRLRRIGTVPNENLAVLAGDLGAVRTRVVTAVRLDELHL